MGDEIEEKKKMKEKYGGKYGGKIWQKTSCHVDLEGGGFLPYSASIFFFAIFRVTDRNMEANIRLSQ